ncbi:MAG: hypothetical protein Q8R28_21130 [Dehalococcoidia bacterium]|nr:hypothetical protein [Dehalococcoidia bacterium]
MTQEIVCHNGECLLLCSDSLVVGEKESGESGFYSFRKLHALGPRTAVLSAGAKGGIDFTFVLRRNPSRRTASDGTPWLVLRRPRGRANV